MPGNVKFSGINTKVSVLRSRLLSDEDYKALMELQGVKEVYNYLNDKTVYHDVLFMLIGQKIHRGDVEIALHKYNVLALEKIFPMLEDPYKTFIKRYMLKYEIEDLKLIIEKVTGKTNAVNISGNLISSPVVTKIDFQDLLNQDTLKKVFDKIKDTKYHRLLEPYMENVQDEKFNFYIEMVLDRYYYSQLLKASKKLSEKDSKDAIDLIRQNIDLFNLEWVYRATKYYDMSKEEILNFVLDNGLKLNYDKLKDLIYSTELSKFKDYFANTEYKFLFSHDYDIDLYMQRRIERFMYYKTLNLYKKSILDFGKILAYILFVEFEIKDLMSIIESKRYKLPSKEISKYLIRTIEVVD